MRGKTVVIVVALAALVSGGAIAATLIAGGDEDVDTMSLVPKDSFFYLEGSRDLTADQQNACDSIAARFPEQGDCASIGEQIKSSFDAELRQEDLSFDEDIEPWLGDDFVLFMTADGLGDLIRASQQPFSLEERQQAPDPVVGFMVAVDDEDRARTFFGDVVQEQTDFDSRSYEGVDYEYEGGGSWAVVDDHLVVATEAGMKAIIDQRDADESIADNERFVAAAEQLRDDRLGFMFLDPKPPIDAALGEIPAGFGQALFAPFTDLFRDPITVTSFLQDDGFVIESTGLVGEGRSGSDSAAREDLLRPLPGSSWGALAIDDVAGPARALLDLSAGFVPGGRAAIEQQFRRESGLDLERDFLSWMGGAAAFVGGQTERTFYAGVQIETSDPATTARTILRLERLLARDVPTELVSRAGFRGFVAKVPGQPQVGMVVVDDDRAVAALGPLDLLDEMASGSLLGDSESFETADRSLGEGFSMGGFFDIDAVRAFAEGSMAELDGVDGGYATEIQPFLEPLETLAFGSQVEGDVVRDRLVIGVE